MNDSRFTGTLVEWFTLSLTVIPFLAFVYEEWKEDWRSCLESLLMLVAIVIGLLVAGEILRGMFR